LVVLETLSPVYIDILVTGLFGLAGWA